MQLLRLALLLRRAQLLRLVLLRRAHLLRRALSNLALQQIKEFEADFHYWKSAFLMPIGHHLPPCHSTWQLHHVTDGHKARTLQFHHVADGHKARTLPFYLATPPCYGRAQGPHPAILPRCVRKNASAHIGLGLVHACVAFLAPAGGIDMSRLNGDHACCGPCGGLQRRGGCCCHGGLAAGVVMPCRPRSRSACGRSCFPCGQSGWLR